jgi:hypothetical protein
MSTLADVTEETLAAIVKAQTTGILESTGGYSYDLTGIVRLIPVVVPFRTKVSRKGSTDGNPFAVWRAYLNKNASQGRPSPGFDFAGNEVIFAEQDFMAAYKPVALAGLVTQDAYDMAKGLYDPYAEAVFQTLNQTLIGEDKTLIGGQSFALPRPATVTPTTAITGGSIPNATTVHIAVAARTGTGYYYGGQSRLSADASIATAGGGAISTVSGSIAAVKGAVAYDWYQSPSGAGGSWLYYTTTTVASVTMTSVIVADAALPTGLPLLSTILPAGASVNTAADNGSGNTAELDGFIASLTADYSAAGQWVTPGTGTANPAIFQDNGGAVLAISGGSIGAFTTMFLGIWNQVFCSPTAIMMNAVQAQEIADLILAHPSAVTYLQTDASGRIDTVAGGRVGHVINVAAGGVTVPIEVHPHIPPGTIIFRTDQVPFPQANVASVLEVRTLRDMSQFDYATARASGAGGGPRKEFEVRSVEAFINRAPVAMGILVNVK